MKVGIVYLILITSVPYRSFGASLKSYASDIAEIDDNNELYQHEADEIEIAKHDAGRSDDSSVSRKGTLSLRGIKSYSVLEANSSNEVDELIVTDHEVNKTIALYELPQNYNKWEVPTIRNENNKFIKIPIKVQLVIQGFRGIDEVNQQVTLEVDLSVGWTDFVIKQFDKRTQDEINELHGVPYLLLDSAFLDKVWWPDIMFHDVVSITKPNPYFSHTPKPTQLRIFEEGFMVMHSRLIVKFHCGMHFAYYPADTQTCDIRLRSYAYSDEDVEVEWEMIHEIVGPNGTREGGVPGVFLADRADDEGFYIFIHNIKSTQYQPKIGVDDQETFTELSFSLSAKRNLNFHLIQTFIPSGFLILITWLSFFLPLDLLEVRISIAMTTLLTLTAMFSSAKEYTPQVSYIKALDIWMLVCIIVVFVALFEFAVLIYLRKVTQHNIPTIVSGAEINTTGNGHGNLPSFRDALGSTGKSGEAELQGFPHVNGVAGAKPEKRKLILYRKLMRTAENYGFLGLAGGFLVFNLLFWPWLLIRSNYYSYDVNFLNNEPDE